MTKNEEITVDDNQKISDEEKAMTLSDQFWEKIEKLPLHEQHALEKSLKLNLKSWQEQFMLTVGEIYDIIGDPHWSLEYTLDNIEGRRTYFQHMSSWYPGYVDLTDFDVDAHPLEDIHENLRIALGDDYYPEDTLSDEEKLEQALRFLFSLNPENSDEEFQLERLKEKIEVPSEDENNGALDRVQIMKAMLLTYFEAEDSGECEPFIAEFLSNT